MKSCRLWLFRSCNLISAGLPCRSAGLDQLRCEWDPRLQLELCLYNCTFVRGTQKFGSVLGSAIERFPSLLFEGED